MVLLGYSPFLKRSVSSLLYILYSENRVRDDTSIARIEGEKDDRKKAARAVRLTEAMRFSPEARTNQEIMATDTMVVRMNCYEPGQVTPMHLHPDEDEVIFVVEGRSKFTFKDVDDLPFKRATSSVYRPTSSIRSRRDPRAVPW